MSDLDPWATIEAEAVAAQTQASRGFAALPLRAYSEFMPPPYVGIKPYAPTRAFGTTRQLVADEYELAHDVEPALEWISAQLVTEIGGLVRGTKHGLSPTALTDNPAWPPELAAAAQAGTLADDPIVLAMALALSRTQDDKGNDRWTLFGTSHDGPAAPVWAGQDEASLGALVAWAGGLKWGIVGNAPEQLAARVVTSPAGLDTIVTFEPFARLPAAVRAAYLARKLALIPTPASLVLFEHAGYRSLARELPRATQIPLLHLFTRVEGSCDIRIPQSGWLDETEDESGGHGHRLVSEVVRTHRWQRISREQGIPVGAYKDRVSTALFSTDPDVLGLYDKPLARNVEIWTEDYRLLLDGVHADSAAIAQAARAIDAGGRFGYRMVYPPMRAGLREVFWHLPVIARDAHGRYPSAPRGYLSAEHAGAPPLVVSAEPLARPEHVTAARQFPHDPGYPRHTTSYNICRLLDARDFLGAPLAPAFARALLRIAKTTSLEDWLDGLPAISTDHAAARALVATLRENITASDEPGPPLVLDRLGSRAVEEQIWSSIESLSAGAFKQKGNADGITVNRGKTGGKKAQLAHVVAEEHRDLEELGDFLHERYRALFAEHGMTGSAEVVDHVFRWETDFEFPWMEGWAKNQGGAPRERNVVCVIPGRNRREAVIMGDHYDTAYMEDVYETTLGGDTLRAASRGADDNHSATTALLLAAEQLLPLARAGKLERDVWLVHLTGEEFPADSLGARAICQDVLEQRLAFIAEDGTPRDVSAVRITGVYVLDMIGHNTHRSQDVFQIAPGEGKAALELALRAHHATLRWNRCAAAWNQAPDRHGAGRAERMPDGKGPPPPFAHLPLHGEVRVQWETKSSLYNTDAQAFSDLGIPVVLLMENYNISRAGYHDTQDTMANIDLDYCTALTAIAIEAVADAACAT